MAICLPWGIWAVLNLPVGSSGVHEWLPEGRPERARYEAFVKGSDERFSSHIAKLESTDQLMRQMTEPPLGLTRELAESEQGETWRILAKVSATSEAAVADVS